MQKLITIAEAAEILRVKPDTIYKWTSAKSIPFVKVGRRVLFDQNTLSEWIAAGTFPPISSK